MLFNSEHYTWEWSQPKQTKGKEQLSAFTAKHKETGVKHFAWHGLGENQLHFSGEKTWWLPQEDAHRIDFYVPDEASKVDFETIAEWLSQLPIVARA